MQDCKIYPSRRVIAAKNVFTCHEDDCHILDRVRFHLRFDTVLQLSRWKCNVNFLLTAAVHVAPDTICLLSVRKHAMLVFILKMQVHLYMYNVCTCMYIVYNTVIHLTKGTLMC